MTFLSFLVSIFVKRRISVSEKSCSQNSKVSICPERQSDLLYTWSQTHFNISVSRVGRQRDFSGLNCSMGDVGQGHSVCVCVCFKAKLLDGWINAVCSFSTLFFPLIFSLPLLTSLPHHFAAPFPLFCHF